MSYDDWLSREPDWHDPGRQRDLERPPDPVVCLICGSTAIRITIASVGCFCSSAHAQIGLDAHEASLAKRAAYQCGICGAFIQRAVSGECKHCGTEWNNA